MSMCGSPYCKELYDAAKGLSDARLAVEASSINLPRDDFDALCLAVKAADERLSAVLSKAGDAQ